MTEKERKEFEEFLKWKSEREKKKQKPMEIDVNAKVNANVSPSINMGWYHKLTNGQKNVLMVYAIWFIVHVILLVSGEGEDHFFPRIYKAHGMPNYEHLRQHGWAFTPPDHWTIKWDLDYYGWPEFIVYVLLIPVIIYYLYILCKASLPDSNKR